ncbi:hypothetical protein [Burkholderia diffusa]|uniref:hypothetical protein n=1 Tax=Burkholderia diffusa TaxID=488732 RepID=UPI0039F13949
MCDAGTSSTPRTFLAAAKEADLYWIGCELEPTYHPVATARLAELDALPVAA